jgi:hypothetical protein
MGGTNGLKEATRGTAPIVSNTLGVNIFTAPGKIMVGERPQPFGEAWLRKTATSHQELFRQMTELYPHW